MSPARACARQLPVATGTRQRGSCRKKCSHTCARGGFMERRVKPRIAVFVYGAGKLGRALARALRQHGAKTMLRAARKGLPRSMEGDIVILAVRDENIRAL